VSDCIVGAERGFRCLPVVPGSVYCQKHHPDKRAENREAARLAARASHARRPDPEFEEWAASLVETDWSNETVYLQRLGEAMGHVATGRLSAAQGNALAALARAARMKPVKASPPAAPLVVEVQRFGNGHAQEGER
jgi:hypothetical protein